MEWNAETVLGSTLILVGLIVFGFAWRRFDLLQRYCPFLCSWGRSWLRWKASKPSVLLGCLMTICMGALVLSDARHSAASDVILVVLLILLLVAVPLGIRDFRRSRRSGS